MLKYKVGDILYFNNEFACIRIVVGTERSEYQLYPILNSLSTKHVTSQYDCDSKFVDDNKSIELI